MSYNILDSNYNPIDENLCIGDTLQYFNNNYQTLDTVVWSLSTQNAVYKTQYNTLIQTLTGFATAGTDYTSLSTVFINLSSLIIQ